MRVDLAVPTVPALVAEGARQPQAPQPAQAVRSVEATGPGSEASLREAQIKAEAEQAKSREELDEVLARLNATVKRLEPHLEFAMSTGNQRVVVKLVDGIRNEVLRQYPSEDIIELSKRLDDLRGLIVSEDA